MEGNDGKAESALGLPQTENVKHASSEAMPQEGSKGNSQKSLDLPPTFEGTLEKSSTVIKELTKKMTDRGTFQEQVVDYVKSRGIDMEVSTSSKEIPLELQRLGREIFQELERPEEYANWLLQAKQTMAKNMVKRISELESKGLLDRAKRMRSLLDQGELDEEIYVHFINEEALRQGWGEIKVIPRGQTSDDDFFRSIKDGNLVWDLEFGDHLHSRDSHIWQLLFAARKLSRGQGREFVKLIAANRASTVWTVMLDGMGSSLHAPETTAQLNRAIFGTVYK